jgi:hypothetical protein
MSHEGGADAAGVPLTPSLTTDASSAASCCAFFATSLAASATFVPTSWALADTAAPGGCLVCVTEHEYILVGGGRGEKQGQVSIVEAGSAAHVVNQRPTQRKCYV